MNYFELGCYLFEYRNGIVPERQKVSIGSYDCDCHAYMNKKTAKELIEFLQTFVEEE